MNQSQAPALSTASRPGPGGHLLAVLGLLVVVLVAHGLSLWDGLFFDDHWHRAVSRDYGWTFDDLVKSGTVDLSGKLNDLWWQEHKMVWEYARPVAMLVTKVEYYLTGGARSNPMGVHACALLWHFLTGVLVYALGCRIELARRWAFLAGLMFLIIPHSFFTVGWTAARNALVGGFFFVAAVLAYGSASLGQPSRFALFGLVRFALALILWGLALFSRETALIFPLVIVLLDIGLGGWRHFARRLPFHVLLWLLTAGFLYWRLNYFSVAEAPEIYFNKPQSLSDLPGYLPWAGSKLLQYLCMLTVYVPMLMGLATYEGLADNERTAHIVMGVVIGLIAIWYLVASRKRQDRWVWPIWVIAAFLPVVPVFAMPHFAYLPSIPYAIMVAIVLSRLPVRCRAVIVTLVVAATLWSLGLYRIAWCGVIRSEQVVYEDMRSNTPSVEPGSDLFFINLPIAAIYTPDAMREIWDRYDVNGHVLTFAPHPLMMTEPCVIEQLNDHEITVSTPSPGYFSGMPGKMLLDGTRPDSPLTKGTVVERKLFDTTVLEADESGVRKLKFTFHKPLTFGKYYFYVSSTEMPGYRIRFEAVTPSVSREDVDLFRQARSDDVLTRTDARMKIRDLARPVAVARGDAIVADLDLQSDESVDRVERWWASANVRETCAKVKYWQEVHARMLEQRSCYFRLMDIVGGIVQTDLFLTGED